MINFIRTDSGFEIWTDTEVARCDGRCVGTGVTLEAAQQAAVRELVADLSAILTGPVTSSLRRRGNYFDVDTCACGPMRDPRCPNPEHRREAAQQNPETVEGGPE